MTYKAIRHHDFSAAHRIYKHRGACQYLHGHNYRVHFTLSAEVTNHLGMVVDFGSIKEELCQWLDKHWDHKTILNTEDPMYQFFKGGAWDEAEENGGSNYDAAITALEASVVGFEGNPTAENMAAYLMNKLGASISTVYAGVILQSVTVEENAKSKATYEV